MTDSPIPGTVRIIAMCTRGSSGSTICMDASGTLSTAATTSSDSQCRDSADCRARMARALSSGATSSHAVGDVTVHALSTAPPATRSAVVDNRLHS